MARETIAKAECGDEYRVALILTCSEEGIVGLRRRPYEAEVSFEFDSAREAASWVREVHDDDCDCEERSCL